jgi:tetratricopeptide (TPR) repeat protein
MSRFRIAALLLVAGLCGAALWRWSVRPQLCESRLARLYASTYSISELRGDYSKIQRAEKNLEGLRELAQQCPADVRVYQFIGVNESLAGRSLPALDAYEKALSIDRRTEIYGAMGDILLGLGRIDEAAAAYTIAARMYPQNIDSIQSEELRRRVRQTIESDLRKAR